MSRDDRRVAAFFALLVGLCYFNVIFLGKSLVCSDNFSPLAPEPWVWGAKGYLPHVNFMDPGATMWVWEPGGVFLKQGLKKREPPFWDPYVGAGAPSMANLLTSPFFPPYFLLVALGNGVLLKNGYFLVLLLAAGYFTYKFLREHGLSTAASAFGGTAFLMSGALNQNVSSFFGQAEAGFPLLLYLTRRFLDGPTRRRAAVLAASYAAVALTGFPPVLIAFFGFLTVWASTVAIIGDGNPDSALRYRHAFRLAGVAILSIGLSAFFLLPAAELLRISPQYAEYRDAGLLFLPIGCLLELFSPILFGGGKIFWFPPLPGPSWHELPYVGAAVLFAALLAGALPGRRRSLWLAVASTAALLTLKIFGVPPIQWLGRLPGLNTLDIVPYFGMLLDFLLAVMAAIGVERFLEAGVGRARAAFAFATAIGSAVLLYSLGLANRVPVHPQATVWMRSWTFVVAAALVVPGLALAALALGLKSRARRAIVLAWIAAAGAEGIWNGAFPRRDRKDVWTHPPESMRRLQETAGSGRVFTSGTIDANVGSAFELFQVDSLSNFNSSRLHRLYRKYWAPGGTGIALFRASQIPPEGVLDSADIETLAIGSSQAELLNEAGRRGYGARFADDRVTIFHRESLPRYFFTSDFRLASAEKALERIGQRRGGRAIWLEEQPPVPAAADSSADPPVEVVAFGRNRVRLDIDATRPGLIYCSETHFPGWEARVNGRPTPILRANFAFRAVPVPAGHVVVDLRYWPPGLTAGLGISAASLLIAAFLFFGRRTPVSLPLSSPFFRTRSPRRLRS